MTDTPSRSLWFPILSLLAVYLAATLLLGSLFPAPQEESGPTGFFVYCGGFLIAIGYAFALRRQWPLLFPLFTPDKWRFTPVSTVTGLILMLAASVVLSPLIDSMPAEYLERLEQHMQGGFWPMLTAVVAAPILEEFLFRGIIQKSLVGRLGPLPGIVLASVLFGVIHVIPQQVIYATVLGMILGSIYYVSGSLPSVIIIHFVNNGLTALLYLFFGTSTGVEHELLGHGWGWYTAYTVSCLILATAAIHLWQRIRRNRPEDRPAEENSGETP